VKNDSLPPSIPARSASEGPVAELVVVTGMSGAGKSTALAALEDVGYHCIENLPPPVMAHALEACDTSGLSLVALGVGSSVAAFLDGAAGELRRIARQPGRRMTTVFLEASDEVLVRRFSETRRPHPLVAAAVRERGRSGAEAADVIDGVRRERELLAPLRAIADVVIDTSALRVHDLRRRVLDGLRPEHGASGRMAARLLTFGFKFGLPADADLVFDVRFLDNPYFVPELRELTGEDARVRDYVLSRPDATEFLDQTERMLRFLLPRYQAEGKSYLTVAIGCTGGKHRSVSIAIALAERLGLGDDLRVVHRDARAGGGVRGGAT
jgi:UPF0042 nucleotide-binding protein